MKRQSGRKYHPRTYEEACEWFVEFRTGTPGESARRSFYAWLQEAPAHMAAYLDVAANWNSTAAVDVRNKLPRDLLIREALDLQSNVVPHPVIRESRPGHSRTRIWTGHYLPAPRSLIAAGITVFIISAAILIAWLRANPTYSTGIGEERLIRLADGSTVDLNARSQIRVHYSKSEREIDLVSGQALFSDRRDPSRPFTVRSQGAVVRAVGTQFDVNRQGAETIVTVVEGKVAVAPIEAGQSITLKPSQPTSLHAQPELRAVYLTAGEQLTVSPALKPGPVSVNVENAIAWTRGQLIFASTPLQDVVGAFNRYSARQLVITDPSLASLRIDGVFSSTNPNPLLEFLRQYPSVRVTDTGERIVISRR